MRTTATILLALGLAACGGTDDPTLQGDDTSSPTPTATEGESGDSTISVTLASDVPISFNGPAVCDDEAGRLYLNADPETGLEITGGEVEGQAVVHAKFVVDIGGDAELQAYHGKAVSLYAGTVTGMSSEGWGTTGTLSGTLESDAGDGGDVQVTYLCAARS